MANNIGPDLLSPALWSARTQILLKKNLVGAAIANTEERAGLTYGYRVHRPYHGDVYAVTYTKGTVPTFQDMTATDEYLDVDQAKIIPVYLDDIDKIQNKYQTLDLYVNRMAYRMRDQIDQAVLANVTNAALYNSTAWSLSPTNVAQAFSEAKASLFNNGVEETKPWYAVVDGDTVSTIEQIFMFNGFKVSDDTLVNGYGTAAYLGEWQGLKMFKSQNLPSTVGITFSDDPTNATTLIINGVTFTFASSIGTSAGYVLIDGGSDVDVTIGTNLVAAINGTTPGTKYYPLSASDRAKLAAAGVQASYTAGSNLLTLTAYGKMVIGGTYDTGTLGTQTMSLIVGQMGAIDLVIQKEVETEILRVTDGRKGYNMTTFDLFGTKMFNEGAQRTYKMTINK
jgi:hypothetical protein